MAIKKDKEVSEKLSPTDLFLQNITGFLGKDSGAIIAADKVVIEKFSSGSLALDIELKGGHVKGTMIEPFGFNQSGKTTSCAESAREFQKAYPNEMVLLVDLEKAFDPSRYKALGVDISPERFILVRPGVGEDAFETMIQFCKTFKGGMIILDSVSLLLPGKEDEGSVGDAVMASQARLMSQGLRKLFPHSSKSNTTVFFINQLRMKIGMVFGNPETTSGGNSLAYYTRTRLNFSKVKGDNPEEANGCNIKLSKASFGNEGVTVKTHLRHGSGFDKLMEILDLSEVLGLIKKSGSWFSYQGTNIGQGKPATRQMLADNPELAEELELKIRNHFNI